MFRRHLAITLQAPDARLLLAALDYVQDIFFQRRAGVDKVEIDLESLYELIDDAVEGLSAPGEIAVRRSREIERLRYELKRCIQEYCFVPPGDKVRYLQGLKPLLAIEPTLTIASLNYDTVIESFCAQENIGCFDYPLEPDPNVIRRDARSGITIELLKLHGSITWYFDKKGKLRRHKPDSSWNRLHLVGGFRSPILESGLVYPSRRKMPDQMPCLINAHLFQQIAREKTCGIVVGYKFSDSHVRNWIVGALNANSALRIVIIDPWPREALINLLGAQGDTSLVDRISVVDDFFEETLKDNLVDVITNKATPASGYISKHMKWAFSCLNENMEVLSEKKISGLCVDSSGTRLFATVRHDSEAAIMAIDLKAPSGKMETPLLSNLNQPRGLALSANEHTLLYVENSFISGRWKMVPIIRNFANLSGAGRLWRFNIESRRNVPITKLRLINLIKVIINAKFNVRVAWKKTNSFLRWPVAVLPEVDGKSAIVTQAKSLSRVDLRTGKTLDILKPPLCFNLCGIVRTPTGELIGIETGVWEQRGFGRLLVIRSNGDTYSSESVVEGPPRLVGIAFSQRDSTVLVCQDLAWPFGRALIFSYPGFVNTGYIGCLDRPSLPLCHPTWDFFLVATRRGLEKIKFSNIRPIDCDPSHLSDNTLHRT
ncbi:MAG TPA: SIR2 family protein [Candidatus Wunengus sp. YC61]|uniref:SIR2 family protein n=1 Tax=Candidatus Wunengus sp. YC61 TaxID=3367698 RepID=UPI00402A42D8